MYWQRTLSHCSTYTQRPSDPPQSAQDKARMDKEYLSLMAELGEAPVPASGGGLNNNPPSGPRGTGPNSNQPPPVSTPVLFVLWWFGSVLKTKVNLYGQCCTLPIINNNVKFSIFATRYKYFSASHTPTFFLTLSLISCLESSPLDEFWPFR